MVCYALEMGGHESALNSNNMHNTNTVNNEK